MNIVLIGFVGLAAFFIPFTIIMVHDGNAQQEKTDQIIKQLREKETCSDLRSDIAFIDKMNAGFWIKQFDDSDLQKYYKEKKCS